MLLPCPLAGAKRTFDRRRNHQFKSRPVGSQAARKLFSRADPTMTERIGLRRCCATGESNTGLPAPRVRRDAASASGQSRDGPRREYFCLSQDNLYGKSRRSKDRPEDAGAPLLPKSASTRQGTQMAPDAQRDEFHAPNSLGGPQAPALANRRGKSTRRPMDDARQARAEGLRNLIWALDRQVRLIVATHILPAKQLTPGVAPPPSEPGAQRVTSP